MLTAAVVSRLFTSRASKPLYTAAHALLAHSATRKPLLSAAEHWLNKAPRQATGDRPGWAAIERQRRLVLRSVLHTVDRLLDRRLISPHVSRVITELWGQALATALGPHAPARRFKSQFGVAPPWFIVIGPGHACNLHCAGCYADSGPSSAHLDWPVLDRLISEAKELWGIPLVVISGGEPLAYRSQGHDILDLVEKHNDLLYLMFTNGTLLDRPIVERLARLGNLTPALSVEGRRERTDERRGAGVYDRVLQAMADLRTAGVPFGVSVTATRNNCEEILSDEFVDYFLGEQGAFYEFIFQFMPIGRAADLDLMPTAEQSAAFWRRSWDVIANKRMFLLDFWNHGPLVEGCVGAGRERGYLYIDWNGGVLPCVFAPFAAANINDVYEYGGTLNDVWNTPFFAAMRQWQRDYGFGQAQISAAGNWMQPCPFRDHHGVFREWIERFQPQPADDAAARSLTDPAYCQRLVAYGQEQEAVKQALWEEAYLGKPSAP